MNSNTSKKMRTTRTRTKKTNNRKKEDLKKGLLFLLIPISALICALIITSLFINLAVVPSGSMENTIPSGSIVFGSRLAYKNESPARGDIVFFRSDDVKNAVLIKRVIAIGGDRFSMKDGYVYINGTLLEEDYLKTRGSDSIEEFTVPEGHLILLGDDRENSVDSRYWNKRSIPEENVIGKALCILFPKPEKIK